VTRWWLSLLLALAAPAAAQEPSPGAAAFEAQDAAAREDPREVVGTPRGLALSGAALDARTEEVGGLLRCPVCQGLSVADSPATMATNMKDRVRELLAEGYDEEQVLAYFERSYGEFVRLEPPRRGINWLVWLAPPLALLAGLAVVRRVFVKPGGAVAAPPGPPALSAEVNSASSAAGSLPSRGALPSDPTLARNVLRVREQAYGWPGGIPPAESA
jgi:cytochrome c-type biogenesis protein CcmH